MPDEAEVLNYMFSINFQELTVSLVIIVVCGLGIYALVRKVQEIMGIETKTMRRHRQIEENITGLKGELDDVKKDAEEARKTRLMFNQKMEESQKEMMDAINKLSDNMEKKEKEDAQRSIEQIRWTIIDFANAITNSKRTYSSEGYVHLLELYDSYRVLLKKYGLENGRVNMAMELIRERYETGLREGFPI